MNATLQISLQEIFEALCYAGQEVDPRALAAVTRGNGIARLAFSEACIEEVVTKWLLEVKGYRVAGKIKWEKSSIAVTAENVGTPNRTPSAVPVPSAVPPRPAPEIDPETQQRITVGPDGADPKEEAAARRKIAESARREMYEDLPPFMRQIHDAANAEAGLPAGTTGNLPDGEYKTYPGPIGKQLVLTKGTKENE